MRSRNALLFATVVLALAVALSGCGSQAIGSGSSTPVGGSTRGGTEVTAAPQPYPRTGHAPDYSWVAGQVVYTKIQGGCTFVKGDDGMYSPNGQAWQDANPTNEAYVVIFGHLAGAGDPVEVCPGGKPYIVDRVMENK